MLSDLQLNCSLNFLLVSFDFFLLLDNVLTFQIVKVVKVDLSLRMTTKSGWTKLRPCGMNQWALMHTVIKCSFNHFIK